MGLEGLKSAARIAGIRGEAAGEVALKQILHKHAGSAGGDGGVSQSRGTQMKCSSGQPLKEEVKDLSLLPCVHS